MCLYVSQLQVKCGYKIISDTPNTTGDISMDAEIMFIGNMLEIFRPTSEVEVKGIIFKSLNKSFDLNPLPTLLIIGQWMNH